MQNPNKPRRKKLLGIAGNAALTGIGTASTATVASDLVPRLKGSSRKLAYAGLVGGAGYSTYKQLRKPK